MKTTSRRRFLAGISGAAAAPFIITSPIFGQGAPSNGMAFAAIGTGRMGTGNMRELLTQGLNRNARLVTVCDVDLRRAGIAADTVNNFYKEKLSSQSWNTAIEQDFRTVLADSRIDGVVISTPDHAHAHIAIAAANAKKHIYVEKPMTYSVAEGKELVKAVRGNGVVLQTGSQQRSSARFRTACELVRNGHLGKIHTVIAQLPTDGGKGNPEPMPVPPQFDFKAWLGPASEQPYTEHRCHPQDSISKRPGFLQIQEYCLGMITGWGAHILDIAQWGLGMDDSGPVEFEGTAEYPERGLFDVHVGIDITCTYADGTRLLVECSKEEPGTTFIGDKGKLRVTRSLMQTTPRELARAGSPTDAVKLYDSRSHMGNFLECAASGKDPICPVEVGHRSNSVCYISHLAAKLGRKLKWDPAREEFPGDDEANRLLART